MGQLLIAQACNLFAMKPIIFIMGVAGSGKTATGQLLSTKIGIPFFDGDDFHSAQNKEKMNAGISLKDEDRMPWLNSINSIAKQQSCLNGAIIACSALKEIYRDVLKEGITNMYWVFLDGEYEALYQRLITRANHYMPASLLKSQLETLEVPKNALRINIDSPLDIIAKNIIKYIAPSKLGIIGLGVMGKNLALNFASKGYQLSVFNRHIADKEVDVAQKIVSENNELAFAKPFDNLKTFVLSLELPRKIILMVSAGTAIDEILFELTPLLIENDIIVDCGNSHYLDTASRIEKLRESNIYFIGAGVSGGEEGAFEGPSIMPSGDLNGYSYVKNLFESIAAKDKNGNPCCSYIGVDGSGHFIKMVHNGIEYAEMQLLAEIYLILRKGLQLNPDQIAAIFNEWNKTELQSYLLQITIDILQKKEDNKWLIDDVLGVALSKGTGKWATHAAVDLGSPVGMMTTALFARFNSEKNSNTQSAFIQKEIETHLFDINEIVKAYQLARMVNHHQGFEMIKNASEQNVWNINLNEVARIWTNGCIIRSTLMEHLTEMNIVNSSKQNISVLAKTTAAAMQSGLAVPALGEAVNYLNTISSDDSSMSLIQAQRDYFGAHQFIRKSDPEKKKIHIDWK